MSSRFTEWSLALLLCALAPMSQAQSTSGNTTGNASGKSINNSDEAASRPAPHKKAKGPHSAASNPGTSGGAGNRSGDTRRDGASFSADRPGAATSKPTGTGWDGVDAH